MFEAGAKRGGPAFKGNRKTRESGARRHDKPKRKSVGQLKKRLGGTDESLQELSNGKRTTALVFKRRPDSS